MASERAEVEFEDLFENAPCGYLTSDRRGRILRANRRAEQLTGRTHQELRERHRFQDLLSAGGRIYWETHLGPLLGLQEAIDEIALELVHANGSRVPVLVNVSTLPDQDGGVAVMRFTLFAAQDRRRYERELLNAQRHEHAVAQALQRSLLTGALPSAPGLELAVSYMASEEGMDVGGDWYDAFWRDEEKRTLALVVGDVVGRGLHAAATMGQLRSAVRALAGTEIGPARTLTELERFAHRHDVGHMTTLAYAELDIESRAFVYACAGHPPPLLISPGIPSEFLWNGRSTPLAARMGGDDDRQQARLTLRPAAAVLLYTDGLVERRRDPATFGSESLRALVESIGDSPADQIVRGLTDALRDPDDPDDVCLLMVRLD